MQIISKLRIRFVSLSVTLLILTFCITCQKPLEQPNVHISASLRLDNDFTEALFLEDVQNLKAIGIREVAIELIVKNNAKYEPEIENFSAILLVLKHLRIFSRVHLIFSKWNTETLYVPDSLIPAWNKHYQALLERCLDALQEHSDLISSVVYGVDFPCIERSPWAYSDWVKKVQQERKIPVFYSSLFSKTLNSEVHSFSDYVGIFYEHEPQNRYKKQARAYHPLLSEKFKDKKIVITHANIEGNEAKLKFQNLLRFWEHQNLYRVNLNSIYNQTVLSRENVYFGLKNDMEFLRYLREYLKGS